jgi:hypothetical protein
MCFASRPVNRAAPQYVGSNYTQEVLRAVRSRERLIRDRHAKKATQRFPPLGQLVDQEPLRRHGAAVLRVVAVIGPHHSIAIVQVAIKERNERRTTELRNSRWTRSR